MNCCGCTTVPWGYRNDRGPSAEPTALACLGLWSCRSHSPPEARRGAIQRGADWLQTLQKADGSLGIAPSLPSPCWTTPHAILLWNARSGTGRRGDGEPPSGCSTRRGVRRSRRGLPRQRGRARPDAGGLALGRGHPLLARADGHGHPGPGAGRPGNHPRVAEGIRVVLDRALAQGGWNYGNTSVFGRQLRPQPGPTGLALLALAAHASEHRPRSVDPAIAYLQRILPDVRAPISLGWGVLGLRAWNASPAAAADWLAESYSQCTGRRDVTTGLSLLLLAHGG